MADAMFKIPDPHNEPVHDYAPRTSERWALKQQLAAMVEEPIEIPIVIGGREVRTGRLGEVRLPHDHGRVIARYHIAGPDEAAAAARAAREAWPDWQALPWHARAAVFLKAAEILTCKHRLATNAATMLGQSKTVHQSEIDAVCETVDFWRYNPYYMMLIMQPQPGSPLGMWNMLEQRPLEGFVFAVTPFNFTSIAANLPTAPAMMGNTVVWKPATTAIYSAHYLMQIYREVGLPGGVINMLPGPSSGIAGPILAQPDLAGVHFTGSTGTFRSIWKAVAAHLEKYRGYPRVVGETGGKNFVMVHASSDVEAAATALVRGAFEYQGQKCSAASRAYIPDSLWPRIRTLLQEQLAEVKVGDVADFSNFMGAVIDRGAFASIKGFIDLAAGDRTCEIVAGGQCDDSRGYFIRPTVVRTDDPHHKLMEEEIFGPVLTVFVYPEKEFESTLELCDATSPYGLTGAIMANDRQAIQAACRKLRYAAGNFYVNDKPTGAVVGQQPFGGARASGTNDKAGSLYSMLRWVSPRTVKETFCPPRDFRYPYMAEE